MEALAMPNTESVFTKAEQIVRTSLGLLEREIVLPSLVWRDAGGSFRGAKDDTISIRLPAYTTARQRDLRAGRPITIDPLHETVVDVTLDKDIYRGVAITDEQLTLDIESLAAQVLAPVVSAVARGVEEELAATITGATYENIVPIVDAETAVQAITKARRYLNDANVPMNGRALLLGSAVEELFLNSNNLVRVDHSGSDAALRDAFIGRLRGVDTFFSNAIPPGEAYMFHSTAYVLSMQAPIVPEGVTFGAGASFAGLAMRVIRDYDFMNVRDRLLAGVFVGTNTVGDRGDFNDDGKWVPWEPEDDHDEPPTPKLIRAVKLTYDEGS
jgi:hypothetical protein